jgi:hypothetical protein
MAKRPALSTQDKLYAAIRGKPSKTGWRTPKRLARALAAATAASIGHEHLATIKIRVTRRIGGRTS